MGEQSIIIRSETNTKLKKKTQVNNELSACADMVKNKIYA